MAGRAAAPLVAAPLVAAPLVAAPLVAAIIAITAHAVATIATITTAVASILQDNTIDADATDDNGVITAIAAITTIGSTAAPQPRRRPSQRSPGRYA